MKTTAKIHHYRVLPYAYNSIVTNPDGTLVQEQFIKDDGNEHKVIYNGNTTVVILSDGTKGVAHCDPADTFNINTGYQIAKARATIKKLEKKIKELANGAVPEDGRISYNSALFGQWVKK